MDCIFNDDDMATQFDEGYARGYEAAVADREQVGTTEDREETLP